MSILLSIRSRIFVAPLVIGAALLMAAACGDDGDGVETPVASQTPAAEDTPVADETPTGGGATAEISMIPSMQFDTEELTIAADTDVTITVGREETSVTAAPLPPEESGQALVDYAHRNPTAAKTLMKLCGYKVDGSDEDYFIMGRDIVPFVALKPRI